MPIPDYQTLMRPMLCLVAEAERSVRECVEILADKFDLTEEEREERLPSGRQKLVYNRAHWAAFYMVKAGLLERPRRGFIVATSRGRDVLRDFPDRVDNSVLAHFAEFQTFLRRSRGQDEGLAELGRLSDSLSVSVEDREIDRGTPEDRVRSAANELNATLEEDLVERIVAADPTFFEHLIIDLMVAMGYGGPGSGRHLGKTSDGGVDGIIRADPLGLDIVFLQAKRYSPGNGIGVDKIREFAGALDERGALKGVFVTTSHFGSSARQYADRSPKRLILIDGEELARLLIAYGVGVRTFETIQLKRIDLDYFTPGDS